MGVSATIDVSDPAAFDVYLNGEHSGVVPALLTPLAQLNSRAEQAARQVAEEQARRQAQLQAERSAQFLRTQDAAPPVDAAANPGVGAAVTAN
jgi:hypothetical protein